ncbi:general stress protein [Microvirga antarctica]|uniref:general stress protein n=1 Tax=Microvirga antarctica TaxID=2819233 RepID=UPI001B3056B2|nr:general stress protein [Microvirga antarctica]
MTTTVSALYDTYDAAKSAVNALEAAGVAHSHISIVANNSDSWHDKHHDSEAAEDAGKGAGIGAAVGGVGGLLTGLGIMAIPGVGPVVAAGWLAATALGAVAGAAVGGAAGGIVGALTEAGVPEHDAHVYAEGVRRGGTLVTAKVEDARATEARAILERHKSVDVAARGEVYRQSGWTRFDAEAPAYTPDEVVRERGRYSGL